MTGARFRAHRLRRPGVTPLSVWNRPTDGGLFWQCVGVPCVEALEAQGRSARAVGRALATVLLPVLDELKREHTVDLAYLTGGLTAIDGFAEVIRLGPPRGVTVLAQEGVWAGAEAGLALAAESGGGAVLDVGQTSIKALAPGHRRLYPRDLATLPRQYIGADGTSRGAPTSPLAAFIGDALRDLGGHASGPCLVLSLPCPLGDDLTPGPCTYGWEGDGSLLAEAFRRAEVGWPATAIDALVLNDGELGAEAARRQIGPAPGARVLVLTLGFGPGGALLQL